MKNLIKWILRKLRLWDDFVKFHGAVTAFRWKDVIRWFHNIRLRLTGVTDGLPIPSNELIHLVTGHRDVSWFLTSGLKMEECIGAILSKNHRTIESLETILDFGCGCGRVIRRWKSLKGCKIYGTDFNPIPIDWCRKNLPFADFDTNALTPPLHYPDEEFDLLYVISVFTHLTEELQHQWMVEFHRVVRSGSLLLLSLHGEHYLTGMKPEEREQFQQGKLVVRIEGEVGSNATATYHPPSYVREKLAHAYGFKVIDFIPEGSTGTPYQDIYLLERE